MAHTTTTVLTTLLILAIAIPAVCCDYQRHRIPNLLVIAGLCGGFLLQIVIHGKTGLFFAVSGLLVGTLCLLPLYVAGATGAGDVKFLGAMGSILGPVVVFIAFILTLLAGFVLAAAAVTWTRHGTRIAPGNSGAAIVGPDNKARIPYAAAICAGSLTAPWALGALDALVPLKLF